MNSNAHIADTKSQTDWLRAVRELVDIVCNSGIAELEVRQGDTRLRLTTAEPGALPHELSASRPAPEQDEEATADQVVTAPLTGVFYWAASPSAPPYVHEGDLVEAGQVVGLVEAMKVFNEVRAERDGRVRRIVVDNGAVVTAGTPLILLEDCSVALDVEALN